MLPTSHSIKQINIKVLFQEKEVPGHKKNTKMEEKRKYYKPSGTAFLCNNNNNNGTKNTDPIHSFS